MTNTATMLHIGRFAWYLPTEGVVSKNYQEIYQRGNGEPPYPMATTL